MLQSQRPDHREIHPVHRRPRRGRGQGLNRILVFGGIIRVDREIPGPQDHIAPLRLLKKIVEVFAPIADPRAGLERQESIAWLRSIPFERDSHPDAILGCSALRIRQRKPHPAVKLSVVLPELNAGGFRVFRGKRARIRPPSTSAHRPCSCTLFPRGWRRRPGCCRSDPPRCSERSAPFRR